MSGASADPAGGPPWHLPGAGDLSGTTRREGTTGAGSGFRAPELDDGTARDVADEVRRAALEAREALGIRDVVRHASRAARRLADPDHDAGRTAIELVRHELGWPAGLAEETISGMGEIWSEAALWGVLEDELGDPTLLDGYGPPAELGTLTRRRRAVGPPLLLVVHAGNVPGVAITAAIRGLLARSGVLSKTPEEEPGLLPHFARTLAAESPLLGRSLAATWWAGPAGSSEGREWVKQASKVVVYGGYSAIEAMRGRVPAGTDLVAYGPRIGIGVVLPDAVDGSGSAPRALARDVLAYEQRGCLSPRLVYVLGDDPGPFGEALADALAVESERRPRPDPGLADAVTHRALRAEAEFRRHAGEEAGAPRALTSESDVAWTVLMGGSDRRPVSEGASRVVRVHSVEGVGALGRILAPLEGRIQAIGYAGGEGLTRVADLAALLGVSRVAPFGTMAWPPADWRHDGRHQLLPLLRWTDWEEAGGER